MRVLLLTQFYPPVAGGQERHVRNLGQELAARGHRVHVAAIATDGRARTEVDGSVPVHYLRATTQRLGRLHVDPTRPHLAPAVDPELRAGIGRLLRAARFDLLHAHDWAVDSALGPARARGVPVLLTQHDYSHACATKRMMRGSSVCPGPGLVACLRCAGAYYGRAVGPAVTLLNFASSRRRRDRLAGTVPVSSAVADRTGVRDLDHVVIPNFVPDDLLVGEPAPLAGGPLLFAGDLTEDKGVGILFEAYRRLDAPPPLLLAGRVLPETPRDVPAGAELLGAIGHGEVIALMRSAFAVVAPSIVLDPSPTVVLEAMASGRPVVGAASGGIVDMVENGLTGLLVAPADPGALAVAMATLLEDPDRAAALGRAGLAQVRSFTASAVVDRLEERYRRAIAGRT